MSTVRPSRCRLAACLAVLALTAALACAHEPTTPAGFHGFSLVHAFRDDAAGRDGHSPLGGLVALPDGSLMGTTYGGGPSDAGMLFRIGPDGHETVLHDFVTAVDGLGSQTRPTLGRDGRVYGVIPNGGPNSGGTLYRVEADGSGFTILHAFSCCDGTPFAPISPVVPASDGNFYGTTLAGGPGNAGGVYRMTPDGVVTHLALFGLVADGGSQSLGLTEGADGSFYGTMVFGGAGGNGTVYRMQPDGTIRTLHAFTGDEGVNPNASLLPVDDGAFLGTAGSGGPGGKGTVFRITAAGRTTVVHAFDETPGQPQAPRGLVRTPEGRIAGTSLFGGIAGAGTVYELRTEGRVAVTHSFHGFRAGSFPIMDRLAVGTDGFLYGTCNQGGREEQPGDGGMGTVFRVAP